MQKRSNEFAWMNCEYISKNMKTYGNYVWVKSVEYTKYTYELQ